MFLGNRMPKIDAGRLSPVYSYNVRREECGDQIEGPINKSL